MKDIKNKALSKIDFFKNIFDGEIEFIGKEIIEPDITEKKDGVKLSIEAILSDGYSTWVIVSI